MEFVQTNRFLQCEYLLSDKQQQQNMNDADTEQALDPNSSIFQSIIQNPIVQRTLNNPKTFFSKLPHNSPSKASIFSFQLCYKSPKILIQ